nr:MAG TPA: hypothetical protein [Caudoviricetes sp.]
MMFLISLNYIKPISEVERILPEHIIFLNKYYYIFRIYCVNFSY